MRRDIVVIGASAGGIVALREVVAGLPLDFPASVFVVVHAPPNSPGLLPRILNRVGPLPAAFAADEERFQAGRIYVAPPDRHLLLEDGNLRVVRGPHENGFRPAVDPLFRTAARSFGPRVIGIVLSGGLDDGSHGLAVIKEHGGIAIVQDPHEAPLPGMPMSALQSVEVDHVVTAARIGPLLASLVQNGRESRAAAMTGKKRSKDTAELKESALETGELPGPPSPITCPTCGGSLWEKRSGHVLQFQCHVGHRFSSDSLEAGKASDVETTLWIALRALEEKAELRRRLAHRAGTQRLGGAMSGYVQQADEIEARADLIRRLRMTGAGEQVRRAPEAAEEQTPPSKQRRRAPKRNRRAG